MKLEVNIIYRFEVDVFGQLSNAEASRVALTAARSTVGSFTPMPGVALLGITEQVADVPYGAKEGTLAAVFFQEEREKEASGFHVTDQPQEIPLRPRRRMNVWSTPLKGKKKVKSFRWSANWDIVVTMEKLFRKADISFTIVNRQVTRDVYVQASKQLEAIKIIRDLETLTLQASGGIV